MQANSASTKPPPPIANTITVACARLGIGRSLLYELMKQGRLRPIKLGTR
ncbi:MAG: DNA-binding protein, partial [Xanthomonadales bacterium]|nr:DNA-binding protein [Xanthomonadales bacterium]